ncbi:MAG: thiosulfate oxidation carrier complex protein SoxZ [Rhodospirillaceae bacterium]|jgi:sulfur-oxidizing protein SoxZ|nr:thiosulfate oxidation carrier complex protein SoxZ [Rhodospirillaceae bacterium]|tara:strand:- start:613 stop:939 length:327 start_codon:yes stop_codon:yes gene_type:complete
MAKKPRVKVQKSAKKGDVIQIKTLVPHKMETGRRKNKKTGKKIPRMIINKVEVSFNSKPVITADLHPAISANPYFSFYARVEESGTFKFTWTDDKGTKMTTTKSITVN